MLHSCNDDEHNGNHPAQDTNPQIKIHKYISKFNWGEKPEHRAAEELGGEGAAQCVRLGLRGESTELRDSESERLGFQDEGSES